jgi:hypothetical protein
MPSSSVTTMLFIAFAVFVMYTRLKGWLDSNIPIFFYLIMVVYANTGGDRVPPIVVYVGFGLALLLRFEFMNMNVTKFVKFLEFCVLGAIVYICFGHVEFY